MKKFPNDSRDEFEIRYGESILKLFPSYGTFWEKFIGNDEKYNDALLPGKLEFPKNFPSKKKDKIIKNQLIFSKISYSIFCNLISAEKQFNEYEKSLKISNNHFLFWAIESYECAYFHIGNISFGLDNLWDYLKEEDYVKKKYYKKKLEEYLELTQKDKNFRELRLGEAQHFRNFIVHNFRYIHTIVDGELYFPSKTDRDKVIWKEMEFDAWIPGSKKLKSHIELSYRTCEDVYSCIIPIISLYYKKNRVKMI